LREQCVGRRRAGKMLLERGMSKTYCYFLDKTFKKAGARAKSLLTDALDSRAAGITWIQKVTVKEVVNPILSLNQFCLYNGVNTVCFSRRWNSPARR